MIKIAIANHKGGTAKTTTAANLGYALAELGRRVLLVDTDPQGSLTQAAGVGDVEGRSLANVLGGAQPGKLPMTAALVELAPNLTVCPADIDLSATELGLVQRMGREMVLGRALATVAGRFDVALIDCPPSLGALTVGALTASDGVLVPTQAQMLDLRGLRLFLESVERIRAELNPDLETLGVLVTFYDNRLTHHRAALDYMRAAEIPLLPVMIGRSVRVADAAGAGQSVIQFDPKNPQAQAYKELAEYVNQWLKNRT